MSRSAVLVISVLFGVSLIAFMIIQVVWIKDEYKSRDEFFQHRVNIALNNKTKVIKPNIGNIMLTKLKTTINNVSRIAYFNEMIIPLVMERKKVILTLAYVRLISERYFSSTFSESQDRKGPIMASAK